VYLLGVATASPWPRRSTDNRPAQLTIAPLHTLCSRAHCRTLPPTCTSCIARRERQTLEQLRVSDETRDVEEKLSQLQAQRAGAVKVWNPVHGPTSMYQNMSGNTRPL
jgi:hypothetical protein